MLAERLHPSAGRHAAATNRSGTASVGTTSAKGTARVSVAGRGRYCPPTAAWRSVADGVDGEPMGSSTHTRWPGILPPDGERATRSVQGSRRPSPATVAHQPAGQGGEAAGARASRGRFAGDDGAAHGAAAVHAHLRWPGRRDVLGGDPARTPVGLRAQHRANPRVRVKVRRGSRTEWLAGTAHIVDADDPEERQRIMARGDFWRRLCVQASRAMSTSLLTIRIDLDARGRGTNADA
jgi:hypothetical protein